MHMSDALLSPAIGATMWVATAAVTACCSRKVDGAGHHQQIPLMGVLGAFVFAAQMVNFTIPGTGSSGHLGGGLVLAILLGPCAAFLVMASVLTVQALFFADGGLLALGCNIFNLGLFPCFVAYPLIYRPLTSGNPSRGRMMLASVISVTAGLQLGACSVAAETALSGISELPFFSFALLMQSIHLGIGIGEGLVTAIVVGFVWKAQPDLFARATSARSPEGIKIRRVLTGLGIAALLAGGAFSWFASVRPDGLEWSIAKLTGSAQLNGRRSAIHDKLGSLQQKTAFLPDYGFTPTGEKNTGEEPPDWPAVSPETSLAGLAGGSLTMLVAAAFGWFLRRRKTSA